MPFHTSLNSNETESCNLFKSAYATFLFRHRASGSVFHFQFVVFLTPHQAAPSLLQPTRGNKNGGQLTLESIVYIMGRELTSRFATESFRCISKSFCAGQTTGHKARHRRQGGQMVRARDMQSGRTSLHLSFAMTTARICF